MTWSFFLADFIAASEAYGGSAHPAGMDPANEGVGSHSDDGRLAPGEPSIDHGFLGSAQSALEIPMADASAAMNMAGSADLPVSHETMRLASTSEVGHSSFQGAPPILEGNPDGLSHFQGGHDVPATADIIQPTVELVHDTTVLVEHVVGSIVQDVQSVMSSVGNVLDTATHSAIDIVGATISNLSDTLGHATQSLTAALDDLGISSSHSLSFAAEGIAPSTVAEEAPSASGYSQYNISIQDAATATLPSALPDAGGITTLVSTALGIGHHTAPDSNTSGVSEDHQSGHVLVAEDVTAAHHDGLFN